MKRSLPWVTPDALAVGQGGEQMHGPTLQIFSKFSKPIAVSIYARPNTVRGDNGLTGVKQHSQTISLISYDLMPSAHSSNHLCN
jgi:hypothetical protein